VVAVGVTVGLAQFEQLRPVEGLHEYVVAPFAVSVVVPPAQTAIVPVTVTVGCVLTVTMAVAVALQPKADVPVTV
jgi:hypothetical protein